MLVLQSPSRNVKRLERHACNSGADKQTGAIHTAAATVALPLARTRSVEKVRGGWRTRQDLNLRPQDFGILYSIQLSYGCMQVTIAEAAPARNRPAATPEKMRDASRSSG